MKIRSQFRTLSLVLFTIVLFACNSNKESNQQEDFSSQPPRELKWNSSDDFDLKYGETVYFKAFVDQIFGMEGGSLLVSLTPRKNTGMYAGAIKVDLTDSELVKGYEQTVTFREHYGDDVENENTLIYLTNGDTITDEFLNMSYVWVQVKNLNEENSNIMEMEIDTIYQIPSEIERIRETALPLTEDLGKIDSEPKDAYVYCFLDGEFLVPYSVSGTTSYSFEFVSDSSFRDMPLVSVLTGTIESGRTRHLYDQYAIHSVRFWDNQLKSFGCNEHVRIYGLWNPTIPDFIVEEFVLL